VGALRLTLGRTTTEADVDLAVVAVVGAVTRIRSHATAASARADAEARS
jgi:cysteine sulfinate desulfinase/cysteine desulfurase-like protein